MTDSNAFGSMLLSRSSACSTSSTSYIIPSLFGQEQRSIPISSTLRHSDVATLGGSSELLVDLIVFPQRPCRLSFEGANTCHCSAHFSELGTAGIGVEVKVTLQAWWFSLVENIDQEAELDIRVSFVMIDLAEAFVFACEEVEALCYRNLHSTRSRRNTLTSSVSTLRRSGEPIPEWLETSTRPVC